MTITHINSQEEIKVPSYQKMDGVYGWLVVTFYKEVLFFSEYDGAVHMEDVTNQYEKI